MSKVKLALIPLRAYAAWGPLKASNFYKVWYWGWPAVGPFVIPRELELWALAQFAHRTILRMYNFLIVGFGLTFNFWGENRPWVLRP